MKLIITLLSSIWLIQTQAQICEDPNEADILLENIKGPCKLEIDNNVAELHQKLKVNSSGNKVDVCENCKSKIPFNDPANIKERQNKYLELTLDSAKKKLTAITLDLFKLRSTYELNLSVPSNLCSLESLKESPCAGVIPKEDIISIQKEFANEMANMISGKNQAGECLFDRLPNEDKCWNELKDSQVLFITSKVAENVLAQNIAKNLKNLTTKDGDIFSSLPDDKNKQLLKQHPLINFIFSNVEASKKFISTLKPEDSGEEIVKKLFSPDLTQIYQTRLEDDCNNITKTISEEICTSENFKQGKVFSNKPKSLLNDSINNNPIEIKDNLRNWCLEFENKEGSSTISKLDQKLNSQDHVLSKISHMGSQKEMAYNTAFKSFKDTICATQENCQSPILGTESNAIECHYQSVWKAMNTPSTPEFAQSNSSDPGINKILSNILGQAQDITPETRKYLVEQSILPNENGEVLAQPRIAERETGYSAPSTHSSNVTNKTAKAISNNKSNSSDRKPSNESNQNAASSPDIYNVAGNSSNSSNASFDSLQPNNQVGQQASNDVFNQELLNRLMKNRTQPFTEKEARKMIEQQLKETKYSGTQVPPQVLNRAVDDFYDYASQSVNMGQSSAAGVNYSEGAGNQAARAKSASEKKYNDLLVKAMESRSSTATPSVSEAKNEMKQESAGQATKEIAITASSTDSIASLLNGNPQLKQLKDEEFILVINEHKFKVDRFYNITKLSNAPDKLFTEVQSFFSVRSDERKKSLKDLNRTFGSTALE